TIVSNAITMDVAPTVIPTINIISDKGDEICANTLVVFTANITNGGANPTYQWKRNGANVGFDSDTFSIHTLNNNDSISCVLTSNANCAAPITVNSSGIIMSVNSSAPTTVQISAQTGNTLCTGSLVTFTANITNG